MCNPLKRRFIILLIKMKKILEDRNICENNNYAMGTSTARSTKNSNYHARDPVIPGIKCDG